MLPIRSRKPLKFKTPVLRKEPATSFVVDPVAMTVKQMIVITQTENRAYWLRDSSVKQSKLIYGYKASRNPLHVLHSHLTPNNVFTASLLDEKVDEVTRLSHVQLKAVLLQAMDSASHVFHSSTEALRTDELLRLVGESLVEKAQEVSREEQSPESGWQDLVSQGLQYKTNLLISDSFRTPVQASELAGVGEAAIRKRIREGKLFALKMPVSEEHRIPVWAIDDNVAGAVTVQLLKAAEGLDAWAFYHFMVSPNGRLLGLCPFELLISEDALGSTERTARMRLSKQHGLPKAKPLLGPVLGALAAEVADNPGDDGPISARDLQAGH